MRTIQCRRHANPHHAAEPSRDEKTAEWHAGSCTVYSDKHGAYIWIAGRTRVTIGGPNDGHEEIDWFRKAYLSHSGTLNSLGVPTWLRWAIGTLVTAAILCFLYMEIVVSGT